jgi:glycosyltransferase involved in cell wall biosynthesis
MRGSQSLPVQIQYGPDQGIARFEYSDSQIDWDQLERLAKTSTAKWILLVKAGADDRIEPLPEVFADERTFAISKQIGWSASKAPLVRTPIRQLQPGEVCRVLAPISEAMLVDRRKLLAIGILRATYAQTAWLMLFWKAAAAGLRCYSVGVHRGGEIGLLPDSPVQDSEFVTRAFSEPDCLRLGPQEPELCRGTISFKPGAGRTLRGKPRVLIVSPYLPFPLSHGGAVRIYNLCRALSDRIDFLLAAYREREDATDYAKLHEVFRRVWVVDKQAPASRTRYPEQVVEYQSPSMQALVAEISREKRPDLLQIEYTLLAPLRRAAPNVPAILVAHDITFALYEQVARLRRTKGAKRDYRHWLQFERQFLREYEAVWTVCEEDSAMAVCAGSRAQTTYVVPNGVDTEWFVPEQQEVSAPEILYVGSFRHFPNVAGFENLCQQIMPRIWRRHPNARLSVIAGREPEKYWSRFAECQRATAFDPRVQIHGFVEDLRPFYRNARVVVAPLSISAGTNIKVLEALASGKPLVTTSIGCKGLDLSDGHNALIRDDWDGFAMAVDDLLTDDRLAGSLAEWARRTAESRFSWRKIADFAYLSYGKAAVKTSKC